MHPFTTHLPVHHPSNHLPTHHLSIIPLLPTYPPTPKHPCKSTSPCIHQTIYHPTSYLYIHASTRNLFIHLPTHSSTNPPIRLSIHSPMYLHNHQIKKYPFLFPFILSTLYVPWHKGFIHHLFHFFHCLFTPALGSGRGRELPAKVHVLLTFLNMELEGIS